MATQRDESGTDVNFPPGLKTESDRFLYREMTKKIEEMESYMSEIVKAVNTIPASIDARIEPVNSQLATIVSTIESHSKTAENVEMITKEFTGFRSFREQFEGYKKAFIAYIWKVGLAAGCVIFWFGWTMSTINSNVGNMKDSVKALEVSDKESIAAARVQGERMKNMDEQLKAVQVSTRETARAVAEISDKSSERFTTVIEAFEKRTGKNNADLGTKIDSIERKLEETSDVLVWTLNLSSDDRPEAKSDTHLIYILRLPPQQRRANTIKGVLSGAVTFFEGELPFRPPGLGAAAYPQGDGVRIELYFQDKSSLGGFVKRLETRRAFRLKITFALG